MSTLFGGSSAASSAAASNTPGDISKDITLTQPPEDSISDVSFSPAADYLAVASWDKKVRIYEVQQSGTTEGKALFEHEAPVLSCCWSKVRPARIPFYQGLWTDSPIGWHESRRCRRRQSRPHARPPIRQHDRNPSRRTRATHPLRALRRSQWRCGPSPRHRLLGQNGQILGPAATNPYHIH